MKKTSRWLSALLVLVLCASLCPVSAMALELGGAEAVAAAPAEQSAAEEAPVVDAAVEENAEEAATDGATSGTCGLDVSWSLSGGTLTISGSGPMRNYSSESEPPWGYWNENIKKLVVKSGVTTVGSYAFAFLPELTGVSLPDTVTRIGGSAFTCCTSLSGLDLPQGLTSIDYNAFSGTGLVSIVLPDGLTLLGANAFGQCAKLESIVIPASVSFNSGEDTLGDCPKLKTAGPIGGDYNIQYGWTDEIPNYAFASCASLTDVSFPDGLTRIGEMAFYACAGLTEVIIPDSVTYIGPCAFQNCENLTAIELPSGLAVISGSLFSNCTNLAGVIVPNGVTAIQGLAFESCSNMQYLAIPATVTNFGHDILAGSVWCPVVFYGGSESQWNELLPLLQQTANNNLLNTTIYFDAPELTPPEFSISCVASSGKPKLSWEPMYGAEKYEVWRSTSKNGTYYRQGSTAGTSYTNTGAVAGKTYYYKVKAISRFPVLNSTLGTAKNMTCDYARPNVSISCDEATGKPKLTWPAVEGATKYEIWRSTSKNGTYTKMYTTANTYYNNTSAVVGKTYYYKVRALGPSSYATSAFSTVDYVTCDCAQPVVSISCKAATGKPVLSWQAVDGAAKYEVWRAYSKNGTYYKMGSTTGTSYTNTGAIANTTYYYKVKAIGVNSYATSAFSTVKNMTCDCARPSVSVALNANGKPRLSWDVVDGAVKYEVWRSTSKDGTYYRQGSTTGTSYTNTGAVSGITYYYKVRALGASSYATSASSSVKSITCK